MSRTKTVLSLIFLVFGCTGYGYGQAVAPADKQQTLVIKLVNVERAKQGLKPLKGNSLLAKAAQSQADWMAQVGRMDHLRGPQPKTLADFKSTEWHAMNRLIKVGYYRFDEIFTPVVKDGVEAVVPDPQVNQIIGENVAYGNKNTGPGRFDPTVIVKGWMDSPGHRAAILNGRFEETGAGYSTTPGARDKRQQAAAWCLVFTGPKK